MKKYLLAVFLVMLLFGFFYWKNEAPKLTKDLQNFEMQAIKSAMSQIARQVSAPPPLRVAATSTEKTAKAAVSPGAVAPPLTKAGTINWTNINRKENHLPPLAEDAKLDLIASLRLKDLFDKQYFAHVSPTGEKAETVAKYAGYDFLALGENLALGDFTDDHDLVTAWMNSPGHRANILNTHYDQIGVAVKAGIFEGEPVWIGVQIFGRPASECPAPDPTLKAKIDANETQIDALRAMVDQKRAELDAAGPGDPSYNQKVDEYNALVSEYNTLLSDTKDLIAAYNATVSAFNVCIAE